MQCGGDLSSDPGLWERFLERAVATLSRVALGESMDREGYSGLQSTGHNKGVGPDCRQLHFGYDAISSWQKNENMTDITV